MKKIKTLVEWVVCMMVCTTTITAIIVKNQQKASLFVEKNVEALTNTEVYTDEINSEDCFVKSFSQCVVVYIYPNSKENKVVIYSNQYPKEP